MDVKITGTLIARLQGQVCELCGCKDDINYEVHRIPSVQKLSEDTFWQQVIKRSTEILWSFERVVMRKFTKKK